MRGLIEYAGKLCETRQAYVNSRVLEVNRKGVARDLARLAEVRTQAVNTRSDQAARRSARAEIANIETRIRSTTAELREAGASEEEIAGIERQLEERTETGSVARLTGEAAAWAAVTGGGVW